MTVDLELINCQGDGIDFEISAKQSLHIMSEINCVNPFCIEILKSKFSEMFPSFFQVKIANTSRKRKAESSETCTKCSFG